VKLIIFIIIRLLFDLCGNKDSYRFNDYFLHAIFYSLRHTWMHMHGGALGRILGFEPSLGKIDDIGHKDGKLYLF